MTINHFDLLGKTKRSSSIFNQRNSIKAETDYLDALSKF